MRILLVFLSLIVSSSVYGGETPNTEFMSKAEQLEEIQGIAKDIRKDYWSKGYADVSSQVEFLTKALLDDYYEMNKSVEYALDSEEISDLYRCYHQIQCELYHVNVTASFYGGYGQDYHYILFYPKTGKHTSISHNVYAE